MVHQIIDSDVGVRRFMVAGIEGAMGVGVRENDEKEDSFRIKGKI